MDIAIGNIVGSNIFNVFFILGTSAIIYPVTVSLSAQYDLLINILASLLLFIFIFTGKGRKINRWEGLIFMILYVLYIISIIVF